MFLKNAVGSQYCMSSVEEERSVAVKDWRSDTDSDKEERATNTWTSLGSNPGLVVEDPATNCQDNATNTKLPMFQCSCLVCELLSWVQNMFLF